MNVNIKNITILHKGALIDQLLVIEWCLVVVYFIVRPIFNSAALNRLLWIPGILIIFAINMIQIQHDKAVKISFFIPTFILFSVTLLGMVQYGVYRTIDQLYAIFAFVNMILMIVQVDRFSISERTKEAIYKCNMILVILFLIYSRTRIAHIATSNGYSRYIKYFCFNLDNTNAVGMYLYCFFCLMLIGSPAKKYKVLHFLLLTATFYMICMTGARTCIIASVFVILIAKIQWKKIPNIIIDGVALFPAIFVYLYLYLYYSGFKDFTMGSADKSFFSGREETFMIYLRKIHGFGQALLGNLGECTFSNAHNSALAIFCSVGLIGVLCTWFIILRRIHLSNKMYNSKTAITAIACILGIFLQSSGEASFFLGGFPAIPFIMAFFLLSCPDNTKLNLEKKFTE